MCSADPRSEPRRSAFTRLAVVLSLIIGGFILSSATALYVVASRALEAEARALVAQESRRLERFKAPVDVLDQVLRARRAPDRPLLYAFVTPEGACPDVAMARNDMRICPVGNLPATPELLAATAGWIAFDYPSGAALIPALGRITVLPSGERLLVARSLAAVRDASERLLVLAVAGGAVGFVLAVIVAATASRLLLRRLQAINRFCDDVGHGDQGELGRRLPIRVPPDEFDSLNTHLNAMLDRIAQLMANARQFADVTAHELKTPLARLRLRLERAQAAAPSAEAADALADALVEIDLSNHLVRTFLEISRQAASDRRGFTTVDLAAVATDTAQLYEPLVDTADAELVVDAGPATVIGEASLLGQVVANLLDNASRHAPPGSAVRLATGRSAAGVFLTVEDRGPGIPPADRERAFEPFVAGVASTTGGHGLGLAFVRAVVDRHGFTVRLEDAEPGLRVVIQAPIPEATG
ncbi:MAG: HAMP domain-containing sensor histidine kinase [Pseudomonadota bacterium]